MSETLELNFVKQKVAGRQVWIAENQFGKFYILSYCGHGKKKRRWFWIWDRPMGLTPLEGKGADYDDCATQLKKEAELQCT